MTMLDLFELSKELARRAVVQNNETDGYAICLICGKSTDPQVFDETGSEHEPECTVGRVWQLIGETDKPNGAFVTVEDF